MSLCYVEGDVVLPSKIAHDPAFSRLSPGRTLLLLLIEAAFARGSAEFDLGHGTMERKARLAVSPRDLTSERIRLR